MKVLAIAGRKKVGKSTLTAKLCRELAMPNNYLFDVNDEYSKDFGIVNSYKGRMDDHENFLKSVKYVRNSFIVFEEAAVYLSTNKTEKALRKLCQVSRHTNNFIVLIFHGVCDLPYDLYPVMDYMALFKTQDFQSTLDGKFRKNAQFIENFTAVSQSEDPHFFIMYEIL